MSTELIVHTLVIAMAIFSVAYIVYGIALKSDGVMKSVGTVLGGVLALVAVLVLVAHLTAPMFGGRPFGMDIGHSMGAHTDASSAPAASGDAGAKPADGGGK